MTPAWETLVTEAEEFESRFRDAVLRSYADGNADQALPADADVARSLIPAGTGADRDFSHIAPEMPVFHSAECVGCMDCVNVCPDTAILAKVLPESRLQEAMRAAGGGVGEGQSVKHPKYFSEAGGKDGLFYLAVDPTKCKGCGECVSICGQKNALSMRVKDPAFLDQSRRNFDFFSGLPATDDRFLTKAPGDMMLSSKALLYVGGAGSCMGCGEATAIRMMLAATGFTEGRENIGVLASTGCNSVFSSTYPYNPFLTPWSNSLFENAPTFAMGVRLNWDQKGWKDKKLWVIGGDGAMNDIGFQALSRMLCSGMDIKVLVLDTQVYSNTGGQASTASYTTQNAKMSLHGKVHKGKEEFRKELANICLMHPRVYVAQTVTGVPNHFYKAILGANRFKGPAVVNVFATCQPEHAVADDAAFAQGRLAAECRAFPLFIHDPEQGEKMSERLSLAGNVAPKEGWYVNPKTGETYDFVRFARSEGRFSKHFDAKGDPSAQLLAANDDRLKNWRLLQELAGLI